MESVKFSTTLPPLSTPLPLYLTRFVGREQERATLTDLVLHKRLVSLVGAGGIGKTRLALQLATEVSSSFPDGVCLFELASLSEPDLLPQALTFLLHLRTDQDISRIELLIDAFRQREALLLMDNCEHLLEACASLVETLLQHCPHLHILVTSREPLNVTGEIVWRVAALSAPSQVPSLDHFTEYEALQLFCERATDLDPRFRLTEQNAPAIVRICTQLDGLPLALELAAARIPLLTVDQLAARLDERFALLTQGKRNAPSRQRTLQAALDWSYSLLTPEEQMLFTSLAVFADSCNLDAVEYVCATTSTSTYPLFDVLAHLVNKSLVIAEEQEAAEQGASETRYRLLDTMRHYALEKLRHTEQWRLLCERHARWYLQVAKEAGEHLYAPDHLLRLQRLENEMANMRLALTRLLETGDSETAVRLADALRRSWIHRASFSEGRYWFETILARDRKEQRLSPALRARVLFGAAEFARYQGANEHACTLLEEQIEILKTLDDTAGLIEAQTYLGIALGLRGEYERGIQMSQKSLVASRQRGDYPGVITALTTLAFLTLAQGDYAHSIALSNEVCTLLRASGNHLYLLYALLTLAQANILQNDTETARATCREALSLAQTLRQSYGIAASLGLVGGLAGLEKQYIKAARLFGAAHALQERVQTPHPPAGRALQERMLLSLRTELGKEQFALHYAAGQACPLDQILLEAEAVLETPVVSSATHTQQTLSATSPALAVLSRREREVLALIATGLTDAQVAQHLVLSPRTVSKHLQSIYTKLNISSRSAATRFALEHHLV